MIALKIQTTTGIKEVEMIEFFTVKGEAYFIHEPVHSVYKSKDELQRYCATHLKTGMSISGTTYAKRRTVKKKVRTLLKDATADFSMYEEINKLKRFKL
ncbi:MAG: hypothetical protein WCJ61_17410 [Paludibacter sp.]